MTGIEYMNTVCPTTSKGKDPLREDVVDAFEDGVAEGYKNHWKPSEEQMDSLRDTIIQTKGYSYSMYLPELYEQLKKLM